MEREAQQLDSYTPAITVILSPSLLLRVTAGTLSKKAKTLAQSLVLPLTLFYNNIAYVWRQKLMIDTPVGLSILFSIIGSTYLGVKNHKAKISIVSLIAPVFLVPFILPTGPGSFHTRYSLPTSGNSPILDFDYMIPAYFLYIAFRDFVPKCPTYE